MVARHFAGRLLWDEETTTYWVHDEKKMAWEPIVPRRFQKNVAKYVQIADPANRLTVGKIEDIVKQIRNHIDWMPMVKETHVSLSDTQIELSTLDFVPYRMENFAIVHLNATREEFDRCESPIFDKYLDDTCTDLEGNQNVGQRLQLQEIAGFVLSNDRAEKAFFLLGKGSNGKSPYLDLLRALVGRDRCHAASLSELTTQNFNLCDLVGKKLNAKAEEESQKVSLARLKEIVSGEPITARRLYEPNFTFVCRARFVYSTNDPPRMDGLDFAVRRRLLVVPFQHTMKETEYDRNLSEKIIASELPAVARWALEGLRRLRKNNFVFTETKQSKEALDEFERVNSSGKEFLSENYERREGAKKISGDLYVEYAKWCRENNRVPVSSGKFFRVCTHEYGESLASKDESRKSVRHYPIARIGTPDTLNF